MSETGPGPQAFSHNNQLGPAQDPARRVVITGMGTLNPLAKSLDEFWERLEKGKSGVKRISAFDPTEYPSQIAGEVRDFEPKDYIGAKEVRRMSRVSQLAIAAAKMAVADAGLKIPANDASEYGIILGTGNSAFPEIEQEARTFFEKGGRRISPFFLPTILPNMCTAQVAMHLGLQGYNSTVITACASGTQSIGDAAEVIRRGAAQVMLAGGADASISELGLAGFCVMRAMSSHYNDRPEQASRPFDSARDGFVPAEGSALLVLESLEHALARQARIYAEVIGFGSSCDAYHLTDPDPSGAGIIRAMRQALKSAWLHPADIDYINAHATGTKGDVMETTAIRQVFGEGAYKIPVNATKSMLGHLFGAAGGVEAIATVLQMQHQTVHPTINLATPDPQCDLDYVPNQARPSVIKTAMSNSFGFGGQNAILIFQQYKPD